MADRFKCRATRSISAARMTISGPVAIAHSHCWRTIGLSLLFPCYLPVIANPSLFCDNRMNGLQGADYMSIFSTKMPDNSQIGAKGSITGKNREGTGRARAVSGRAVSLAGKRQQGEIALHALCRGAGSGNPAITAAVVPPSTCRHGTGCFFRAALHRRFAVEPLCRDLVTIAARPQD